MEPSFNTILKCEKCGNRGYISVKRKTDTYPEGVWVAVECECNTQRENLLRLEKSGLKDAVKDLTFETFKAMDPFQKAMLNLAKKHISQNQTPFFYIGGQVGSGKTHICTAMCGYYLQQKSLRVIYTTSYDLLAKLKANVNDDIAYYRIMNEHTSVDVLYIDDLFKSKPTEADINHMFNLVNKRYASKKKTIFSSEKSISDLIALDEGLGSRIKQVSGEYCLEIGRDEKKNYRLR